MVLLAPPFSISQAAVDNIKRVAKVVEVTSFSKEQCCMKSEKNEATIIIVSSLEGVCENKESDSDAIHYLSY